MGHFVKTLGSSGDRETETEVLLLEHDVPYQEFSKRVLEDLPREGDQWVVLEKHLKEENRRDFRDLNVCSIDPPGCTDIDDALHVRPLPNGNFEVGVRMYMISVVNLYVSLTVYFPCRHRRCYLLCQVWYANGR